MEDDNLMTQLRIPITNAYSVEQYMDLFNMDIEQARQLHYALSNVILIFYIYDGEILDISVEKESEYREPGVKWSIDEVPVKKTRPIGWIYRCEQCGKRFEFDREIHIPWCDDCRIKSLNEIKKRS